jgi:lipid-A-disaccharide synthase
MVPSLEKTNAAAVLTSSGTMSLACALAGIPGAIAYRANLITYLIARRVIRVPYLGIANLILDHPVYPEFLQGAARPAALADEIRSALEDADRRTATAEAADQLRACLHDPDSGGAAEWLLGCLSA